MTAFRVLLKRELTIAARQGGSLGTVLGFYLVIVALMPLGLGPDLALLSRALPTFPIRTSTGARSTPRRRP